MGHLISARAFRLGISFEWMDVWYAKDIQSYIFILFTCFRLRYFFLSYLYAKKRDKGKVIYSHIEFVRKRKNLFLQIFFYDSTLFDVFKTFGSSLFKTLSTNIYSYLIEDNNLNKDSISLLLDSDSFNRGKTFGFQKEIWINNYLYFKNLLWLNSNNNNVNKNSLMFTKSVDNLFLFFSYKHLTSFLNNKFSSDLKSKKGLVQKLRKFSLVSSFYNKKFYNNNLISKIIPLFVNSPIKSFDFSKLFFSYSLKKSNAYSFIHKWFDFDIMDSGVLNIKFLKDSQGI